jgi:hypothetical protein
MTKLRRYATAGLAALILTSLSACGDDSSPAATSTGSPSSSTPESSLSPDEAEAQAKALSAAKFQEAVAKAQSQKQGQSAHLEAIFEMSYGGQSMDMTMSGDYAGGADPDDAVMDMSINVSGQQMQLMVVDKSLYMKGPGLSASPGKPWVQVDLDDPNSPFASIYESANPRSFTEYFAGAKRLEDLGKETIDGVETTHYAVTVSTKKMLEGNKQFAGMNPSLLGFPKQIRINAWLNADQLPIKMVVPFGELGSFEAHFSKYGEPVHVVAPPAKLVSQYGVSSL